MEPPDAGFAKIFCAVALVCGSAEAAEGVMPTEAAGIFDANRDV